MSPRVGLSRASVVDAAMEVLDAQGPDQLTLANVAARTGVATPSLYKHVAGLAELRSLVGLRVMQELTEHCTAAILGLSGDEAISTLMHTMRDYCVKNPRRYALMPYDALQNPITQEIGAKLLNVFLAALRAYGLEGSAAIHATRRIRVIAHGFASLEAAGGFGLPEDLDETYQQLIDMILTSVHKENSR